jgi:hypothetical protein
MIKPSLVGGFFYYVDIKIFLASSVQVPGFLNHKGTKTRSYTKESLRVSLWFTVLVVQLEVVGQETNNGSGETSSCFLVL